MAGVYTDNSRQRLSAQSRPRTRDAPYSQSRRQPPCERRLDGVLEPVTGHTVLDLDIKAALDSASQRSAVNRRSRTAHVLLGSFP